MTFSGGWGYPSSSNSIASLLSASAIVSKKNMVSKHDINVYTCTEVKVLPYTDDVIWSLPMLLSGCKEIQPIRLVSIGLLAMQ
jgi:hypothetical protein